MALHYSIVDREYAQLHAIIDTALTNPEQFRRDARAAYRSFLPKERTATSRLHHQTFTAYDFFIHWEASLKEARTHLRESRRDKTFQRSLTKHLALAPVELEQTTTSIITSRDHQLINRFLDQLYPLYERRTKTPRKAAVHLLRWSDTHLYSLRDHLILAVLYKVVSERYNITYIDPFSPLLQRIGDFQAIVSQRRKMNRNDRRALHRINKQHTQIAREHHSLIQRIDESGIELITILAARASYEKKLAKLDVTEAKDPEIRLALFHQETKKIHSLVVRDKNMTLEETQQNQERLSSLLLTIFTLSNVQKNLLMNQMKKFHELTKEYNEIAAFRDRRKAARHAR